MDDVMGVQLLYLSWAVMGGPVTGDYKRDVSPAKKIVRNNGQTVLCRWQVPTDIRDLRLSGSN